MEYHIKDPEDNKMKLVPEYIANGVLQQYLDKRYIGVIGLGSFIIGFLLGILAYAL